MCPYKSDNVPGTVTLLHNEIALHEELTENTFLYLTQKHISKTRSTQR